MGDVRIVPQKMTRIGITPSYTTPLVVVATSTYIVKNNGRMFLHFKKSAAVDANIVIETPVTVDGLTVQEQGLEVLATVGDKMIGPFAPAIFNDGVGDVRFGVTDDIDGLSVAAVEI